jgi:integrase
LAAPEAQPCSVCQLPSSQAQLLWCRNCGQRTHRQCSGMAATDYPGGCFTCATCTLQAAGLPPGPTPAPAMALAARCTQLAGRSVAVSTAGSYRMGRQRFVRFCTQLLGVTADEALPVDPAKDINPTRVALFLAYGAERFAAGTLSNTLSALADWQRSRGVPAHQVVSRHPEVLMTLRRVARDGTSRPPSQRVKAPMTVALLRLLVGWLHQQALAQPSRAADHRQDQCWLVVGFYGMLRRSELQALKVGHILRPSNGSALGVHIARSKTDQLGRGIVVWLAPTSGSGVPIDRIVARHLASRLAAGAMLEAPLFVAKPGQAPGGAAISKGELGQRLHRLLSAVGDQFSELDLQLDLFAMHSLRRGGATAAAEAGVSRELIKIHGRWRSDAVDAYLQASLTTRMSVVQRM